MPVAVVNAVLTYKYLHRNKKMTLLTGREIIINLLGIQDGEPSVGPPMTSNLSRHVLTKIPSRHANKILRKHCIGCYKTMTEQGTTPTEARRMSKFTDTECLICKKTFCAFVATMLAIK